MFEHPLGLPQKVNPHRIAGTDHCVAMGEAAIDYTLNFPVRHGEHNWQVVIHMPTSAQHLLAGAIAFRPHLLAGLHAYCWVCERDFDEHIAQGPCLGDPRGREVPTRAEFRAWTDEQKVAWIDGWTARGPGA